MEATPNLQVYDLGHLGLVASILDQIELVQTVDQFEGLRPGEKIATSMALKASLLNALSFISAPLYVFGHFFQGKPRPRPTLRWILRLFIWVRLLGAQRYYLLK